MAARLARCLWVLLALLCLGAQAMVPAEVADTGSTEKALTQFKIDTWQTEQGLPQNAVSSLLQTRDGYLWIGTLGGLARFDGVRFTTFDNEFPDIATQPVMGLMQDTEGNVWIGHNKGAAIYRHGKFERAFAGPGNTDQRVWDFAQGLDGVMWAATNHGLVRWEKGVVRHYLRKDGLPTDRLRALAFDRDGVLWIATSGGGLVAYAGGAFKVYNTDNGFPHLQVRAVLPDPAGGVWASTAGGGLAHVAGGTIKVYTTADGLPTDQLTSLARDQYGHLWVGTWGGGVSRMVGERFSTLSSATSRMADHIWSLKADNQGEIWIGTWVSGLMRMRERTFGWLGVPEGLSNDNTRSVLTARDGATWIATAGGGLNRVEHGVITRFGKQQGLPSDELSSLAQTRDGAIWAGSYTGGVVRIDKGKLEVYGVAQGLPSVDVRALFEDRDGTLWAGTPAGLARLAKGGFETVREPGAPTGNIGAIAQDPEGTLWFGTGGEGLVRYRGGLFTTLTVNNGLLSNWIMSLYVDGGGALWIGTNGDGLNRLHQGRLGSIRQADGLWDGTCLSIQEDADANLWITSNRGVFRVARSALEDFAEGRAKSVVSAGFGPGDAMRSATFAGGLQPAGALDQAGRLLLPSTRGLVIIDPRRLPDIGLPPGTRFERVQANGMRHLPTDRLVLPPGPATVAIHYSAATLLNAERVRFRYQMEGLTEKWIDAGSNREVSFPALAHGKYRFRLITSFDGKLWSDPSIPLEIEVRPYYYETTWFALLMGACSLLLLYAAFRLRMRSVRIRHARMEQLIEQKTEALRLANEHLSRLSFLDALTGLANRRRFDEVMAAEWQRACRTGLPLSLLIADIDFFGRYNEAMGHPEGDRCLAAVAAVFMGHARRSGDLAARYGGEEFVILLPDVGQSEALQVAESVRAGCETLAIPHPASDAAPVVTLSIGVATCIPADPAAMLSLLQSADLALYRAKHEGRNRVHAA